ncbi:carboxylesterase family protein [Aurantimonas sp. MSK8Z-1]|uniref:carboxylesterase/lipase family protein n=1 Tax=Mangrovibrevibacter kandeliae TaxID=2968473 RepID=UPI00222F13EF|nr:carboxylesterase family protein [Aurantimonas sp. MSK8Z-1]MCW4114422.1 carboxylesterase family protein [Aurantimonas sp. MSK8Z-1]
MLEAFAFSTTVTVDAPCGIVSGRERDGVSEFLGIPYAEPIAGDRRFAAPVPRGPFTQRFNALTYGMAAPQRRALPEPWAQLLGSVWSFGENCLNLNVWTPGVDGRRPVLVFVHGGGFVLGAGAQYPGGDLARRGDVVVVTLNYRLGLIGFNGFAELYPDDERFVPNAGLLDQRLALEWVRDNIEAFGGDPGAVTLMGESAGAASVGFHLLHRPSWPLFHRAILQSGGINLFHSRARAAAVAQDVLRVLDLGKDPAPLLKLPTRAFGRVAQALSRAHVGIPSRPYLDGAQVPERPLARLYEETSPVPLVVGTNRDEFSFFSDLPVMPLEADRQALTAWVAAIAGEARAARVAAAYPAGHEGDVAFGTDLLFRMPAQHLAEAHAARAPTYAYRLDWGLRGVLSNLGATHSVDLPLLFDDFARPFRSAYFGLMPDGERRDLSDRMKAHWLAFVRDGAPALGWPRYDPDRRRTLVFDTRDSILADPDQARREVWDGIDSLTD